MGATAETIVSGTFESDEVESKIGSRIEFLSNSIIFSNKKYSNKNKFWFLTFITRANC